ncbi:MAG: PAS domain-containing protein [Anaerolineaceae bacterium]|nr:MAG: PAS domain-containing protein [Anaerolineaceae bacterium]
MDNFQLSEQTRERIKTHPLYKGDVDLFIHDLLDMATPDPARQTASEMLYTSLDHIDNALFLVDNDWRFVYLNNKAESLLRQDLNSLIGARIWDAFPDAVGTTFHTEYQRVVYTRRSSRFTEYFAPLQTWFEVQADAMQGGLIVQFRDVTARKKLEDALQRSVSDLEMRVRESDQELTQINQQLLQEIALREEAQHAQMRLVNILETTSDYVTIVNEAGEMLYINQAARAALAVPEGTPATDYKAKQFFRREDFKVILRDIMPQVDRDGTWQGEITVRGLDGREIAASKVIIRHDQADAPPLYSAITRDISHRKHIEDELRQTLQKERELSELKSRFSDLVSHEFRTPLAIIQTSTDLILRYNDRLTPEKRDEYLERIQQQITQLKYLLDDFSTMGRADLLGQPSQPTMVDFSALCVAIITELRQVDGDVHNIEADIMPTPRLYFLDHKLLREMVINLLSNALKYSHAGSTVKLKLSYDDDGIELQISDEGVGIAEDEKPHIFDSFFRGRNVGHIPGTGLGGVLIRQAVKAHNGALTLDSQLDVGTTVTVRLPAEAQQPVNDRKP